MSEELETVDDTSELTPYARIYEQEEEIKRLRRALQNIADNCAQDPDIAEFAAWVLK